MENPHFILHVLQWVMIYSFGINTDFGNRSQFDPLPCRPQIMHTFCLIHTMVLRTIVCFPIDSDVWKFRTYFSRIFVQIIRATLSIKSWLTMPVSCDKKVGMLTYVQWPVDTLPTSWPYNATK